jgi:hypothetical protein
MKLTDEEKRISKEQEQRAIKENQGACGHTCDGEKCPSMIVIGQSSYGYWLRSCDEPTSPCYKLIFINDHPICEESGLM